jgi:hypothetical protein
VLNPTGSTARTPTPAQPCGNDGKDGKDGKDAGPHFQLKPDPVTPHIDPAYANNMNEI